MQEMQDREETVFSSHGSLWQVLAQPLSISISPKSSLLFTYATATALKNQDLIQDGIFLHF